MTLVGFADATGFFILGLAILYFGSVLLFGGLTTARRSGSSDLRLLHGRGPLLGRLRAGRFLDEPLRRTPDGPGDRFGWEMPASFLQSVNSIFLILMAPLFGSLWVRLGRARALDTGQDGMRPRLMALGFFLLAWAAYSPSEAEGSARCGSSGLTSSTRSESSA